MRLDGQTRQGIGAWIGALVLLVCLLTAAPVTGQASPLRFNPDDTEKQFRALSGQVERDGVEGSARPVVAERSNGLMHLSPSRLTARPGFFKGHLLPRMSRQLGEVASIYALETPRDRFDRSSLHDWVSDAVAYRVRRATRKAVRTYLLEEIAVGSWVESLRVGRHGFGQPAAGRATDFGIEVSHGIPVVGMRHRSAVGTTRVAFGLDGSVKVRFRPTRSISARLAADYDADLSQYRVSCRFGF
ncbi:MAG: hypothetical protein IH848_06495 [Acidobacteria bacterium]|nr:hypothetical protein [Acidobacteriota bacterium]